MFVFQVTQKNAPQDVQAFKPDLATIGTFSPQSKVGKAFDAYVDLYLVKINPVV